MLAEYTLKLTANDIKIILMGLGKLTLETSLATFSTLQQQVNAAQEAKHDGTG